MTVAAETLPPVPLVVDVDGTLLKGDLLHEAALQFVARHPWQMWRLASWLTGGKAHLKARLADCGDFGVDAIPLRDETVAVMRAAQAEGRSVYVASASDRRWVEPVAARIGGVTGVFASDGVTNLAGAAKASVLVERFGSGGFDYIGDHRVDLPVWASARRRLVVAHDGGLEATVARRFPDAETIARPRMKLRAHLRALRMHQWAKNTLVFLPMIAGHDFTNVRTILAAIIAFFAFSFAASSAYVINDLLDLPGDRDHVRKRRRPFAAGDVSITRGLMMMTLLMAAAIALALLLPWRFLAVLVTYIVLTLSYSLVLKRKMLVDVIVLGGLYTIRVFGGVTATAEVPSQWLMIFSLFLFLNLALVKRCSELIARRDAGKPAPLGRGYYAGDLGVLLPLAAAAGYGAVLVFALYLSSSEIVAHYAHPKRMYLIVPLLLYWISRVLVLSNRNEMHDDPVIFALTDRISWATGACAAAVIAVST